MAHQPNMLMPENRILYDLCHLRSLTSKVNLILLYLTLYLTDTATSVRSASMTGTCCVCWWTSPRLSPGTLRCRGRWSARWPVWLMWVSGSYGDGDTHTHTHTHICTHIHTHTQIHNLKSKSVLLAFNFKYVSTIIFESAGARKISSARLTSFALTSS